MTKYLGKIQVKSSMHLFLIINYSHRERCYWFYIMNEFWSAGHISVSQNSCGPTLLLKICFFPLSFSFPFYHFFSPFFYLTIKLFNGKEECWIRKKKSVKNKNCCNCYLFTDTHFLQWCMSPVEWAIVLLNKRKIQPPCFQAQYPFTLQVFLNHPTQTQRTYNQPLHSVRVFSTEEAVSILHERDTYLLSKHWQK